MSAVAGLVKGGGLAGGAEESRAVGQAAAAGVVVGDVAVGGAVFAAGAGAAAGGAAAAEVGADVGGAGACHHDLTQLQDEEMCSSWAVYASEKNSKDRLISMGLAFIIYHQRPGACLMCSATQ